MPTAPLPHGLRNEEKLSSAVVENYKLNKFIGALTFQEWNSIESITSAFYEHNKDITSPKKALSIIKATFSKIASKTHDKSLQLYCERLKIHLNKKSEVNRFDASYTGYVQHRKHEIIQHSIQDQQDLNAKKAELLAHKGAEKSVDIQLRDCNNLDQVNRESTNVNDEQHDHFNQKIPSTNDDQFQEETPNINNERHDQFDKENRAANDDRHCLVTIKQAAMKYHNDYTEGKLLTINQRNIMSSGLSSIFNFVDSNVDAQLSLFQVKEWEKMAAKYKNKYTLQEYQMSKNLCDVWNSVVSFCENDDIESALYIVQDAKRDVRNDIHTKKGLEIIEQVLTALNRHEFLLDSFNLSPRKEYDIMYKICAPLFDCLFGKNSSIDNCTGETINMYSASQKNMQYEGNNSRIISFKIDIRFFVHHHTNKIDIACAEAAANNDHDKVTYDLGKLVREAKDVLDGLLLTTLEQDVASKLKAFAIQLTALQGQISTVHLDSYSKYVAIPQQRIMFPSSPASICTFKPTLTALLTLRLHLENTANKIKRQWELVEEKRNSLGANLNHSSAQIPPHSLKEWQVSTWYTPPCEDVRLSGLPTNFNVDN